ncbi:transcriptional regulator TbsP [Halobaculum lipolyticum]|uniref:Transcriptional regulator TbsP n=1 Tax=Halobaculum lipolyticum TaxID=3032001 RepID=A0ABD5W5C3_9EURY
MTANLLEGSMNDLLRSLFDRSTGEFVVVNPTESVIESLVDIGSGYEGDLPTLHVLADDRLLKDVMDDFLVAADAADLIDAGHVTLRELVGDADNTLVVGEDELYAIVDADEHVAALAADDDAFIADAYETYRRRWEDAPEFNLRTPALSRIRATLDEDIGEDVRADFDSVLASLETARGDGEGLDEVTISLLVAAKNDVLLYDISKWGEDVGIASKATFSRTKTRLEDLGLIDTEKVPIDVGRPRLRLKLGDDRLRAADGDELASVAYRMLN